MFDGKYSLSDRGEIGQNIWNEYSESPIVFRDPNGPPVLQYKWEFERLLELYYLYCPKNVVEIGSWKGGTLYQWIKRAEGSSNFLAISEDAEEHHLYEEAEKWAHEFGTGPVVVIGGSSHNPSLPRWIEKNWGYIDFLFIDGDHSYEGAKQDFEMYGSLVRKGGLIVLQDILYAERHPEVEVYKLWKEIREAGYKCQEFYTHPSQSGLGIGVVYVE